ncbi:hypothetical protein RRG08_040842, partial [Elysia crispata]
MFLRSGRVVVPREEPGLDAPAPNPDYQAPEILRNGRDLQGLGIDLQNPDRDAPAFPEDRGLPCFSMTGAPFLCFSMTGVSPLFEHQ